MEGWLRFQGIGRVAELRLIVRKKLQTEWSSVISVSADVPAISHLVVGALHWQPRSIHCVCSSGQYEGGCMAAAGLSKGWSPLPRHRLGTVQRMSLSSSQHFELSLHKSRIPHCLGPLDSALLTMDYILGSLAYNSCVDSCGDKVNSVDLTAMHE